MNYHFPIIFRKIFQKQLANLKIEVPNKDYAACQYVRAKCDSFRQSIMYEHFIYYFVIISNYWKWLCCEAFVGQFIFRLKSISIRKISSSLTVIEFHNWGLSKWIGLIISHITSWYMHTLRGCFNLSHICFNFSGYSLSWYHSFVKSEELIGLIVAMHGISSLCFQMGGPHWIAPNTH